MIAIKTNPRILLTGSTGQVGGVLLNMLPMMTDKLWAPTRAELDLYDTDNIAKAVQQFTPDIIINPAAYTAVDQAEDDFDNCYAVNESAVKHLAQALKHTNPNGVFIHYSTDYVFDGTKATPYLESDSTNPQSVYGKSKLAGEQALANTGIRHLIFRSSWVYSDFGKNFVNTIKQLAVERKELTIVADQIGAPTSALEIATVTLLALKHLQMTPTQSAEPLWGIYNLTGKETLSWYAFAQKIVTQMKLTSPPKIKPQLTKDYPFKAPRPLNSRLSGEKIKIFTGLPQG